MVMHSAHYKTFSCGYLRKTQFNFVCIVILQSVCRWSPACFVVVLFIYESSIHLSQYKLNIALLYMCGVFRVQSLLLIDSRPSTYSYIQRHSGVQSPVRFHANEKKNNGTSSIELPKKTAHFEWKLPSESKCHHHRQISYAIKHKDWRNSVPFAALVTLITFTGEFWRN